MGPLVELTLDNGHYISVTGDSLSRPREAETVTNNRKKRLCSKKHLNFGQDILLYKKVMTRLHFLKGDECHDYFYTSESKI